MTSHFGLKLKAAPDATPAALLSLKGCGGAQSCVGEVGELRNAEGQVRVGNRLPIYFPFKMFCLALSSKLAAVKWFITGLSTLMIFMSKAPLLALLHYRERHSYGCFEHPHRAPQPRTVSLSSNYVISYTVHQVMMTWPKPTLLFTRNHR